ncbi:hypothetical protein HII17_11085 [Thalassotalea sp. M1531]|uniref:Outer membrane protein beta-barrel domain-containing protein n=1 Tax=Thalassotalea algicola TaxID=2716224 RepID=A0A7Y0LCN4_9GAMM|nr:hypothetical protein [Thalassotalea algicola]NMP32113.1 hypothetical protein [Thalassotalea algicola]
MHTSLLVACILLVLPYIVCAQEKAKSTFEFTPFTSYRLGGDFDEIAGDNTIRLEDKNGYGLIAAWHYDHNRQGELLISHYVSNFDTNLAELHGSEVAISYVHLGGNIKLSNGIVPFWLSGGVGFTHLSPNAKHLNSETNFSASLGLNSKLSLSENMKIFIGGRIYGTFFDSESEVFCDSTECAIFIESEIWIQSELLLGVNVMF